MCESESHLGEKMASPKWNYDEPAGLGKCGWSIGRLVFTQENLTQSNSHLENFSKVLKHDLFFFQSINSV